MEPASPQGSHAKEGGGIKGRPKPWCRRLFGDFLAVQKVTQPVESVERKNRLSFFEHPRYGLYIFVRPQQQCSNKVMDFTPILTAMMGLDYNSSSIGIDFGAVAPGIKKIQIIPDGKFRAHRVTQRTLDLYTSPDNTIYTMASRSNWSFTADSNGVITITLKESVATRYLKIHVKFDERDSGFTAKNKATFLNDLAKMLRIYQEASSRTEEFHYYAAGNRKDQIITLIRSNTYSSSYYTNSDRLKTDGKFAFKYDEAGNLTEKGNKFTVNGDNISFIATSGDGVEYWQYRYDLLNRLIAVTKNGTIVSDYEYSPDGLREVKRGSSGTVHYVFEGTEPIFEKRIADGRIRSYVYALGKHLARVDGVIGDSNAKVYYYHTDHEGSIKVVTDATGKVVYNADYFAFGTQFSKDGDFDETHTFTGKEYDPDINLYYYNARFYDSETGRFISEDSKADPNNPNLYSYCANDPLNRTDPTGLYQSFGHAFITRAACASTGFSGKAVNQMVAGNVGTDNKNSPNYDRGQHFNTNVENRDTTGQGRDSRDVWADKHLANAISGYNSNTEAGKTNAFKELGSGLHSIEDSKAHTGFWGNNDIIHSLGSSLAKIGTSTNPDNPFNSSMSRDAFYKSYVDSCEYLNDFKKAVGLPVNNNILDKETFFKEFAEYINEQAKKNPNDAELKKEAEQAMQGDNKPKTEDTSTKTNSQNNSSSGNSDQTKTKDTGNSTTSQKIICKELFRQGLMDKNIYQADEAFGEILYHKYPIILAGYHAWAKPVVRHMKESKTFTHFVNIIAKPWSYEMAHIMGKREKGDLIGKVLMYVGFVVCLLIGMVATNMFYINYISLLLISIVLFYRWQKYSKNKCYKTIVRDNN